jgi:hypothetical protein
MGKGKGSFDYWASRVAVSKIIFELKGDLHEKVAREAFRLAANKMPGILLLPRKRRYAMACIEANRKQRKQVSMSSSSVATRPSWASRNSTA